MNGTRRASLLWGKLVCEVMVECGCIEVMVIPMMFRNIELDFEVVVHGDDFAGEDPLESLLFVEKILLSKSQTKRVAIIGPGMDASGQVLKRTISWNASGFHWHTDPKHSERIVEQLGLTQGKPSDVPGSKSVGKTVTTRLEPLSEEDAASYASNAGSGLFHALDRPDLQFTVGRLMSHISCPNELDQLCLKLFGRYLIDKTECVWHYEYQPLPKCLTVLGDSDWATNEEHRRSVDCVHEYFGRHLWDTSSSTQDLVATSSGVAEFYAQVRGAALGIQNQNIMKQCDLNLEVQFGCDASAARGMMQKQGGGRVKHIDIKDLWIQQFIRDGKLKVFNATLRSTRQTLARSSIQRTP